MAENIGLSGKHREVGRHVVPENHVYPLHTDQERDAYYKKLFDLKARDAAMMPVCRVMAPDEPRVKRFHTLEEANIDQLEGIVRTAQAMQKRSVYVYR